MGQLVNFFPLSVYIGDVEDHAALREAFAPRIRALVGDDDSRNVWTGDVHGHGFLHRNAAFDPLLDALVPHIHAYLDPLGLQTEELDLFFQRSWPVVARRDQQIAIHQHAHAHLSFVYYLEKPEGTGGIRLVMEQPPNEIVPHLFQQPVFAERTTLNSSQVDMNLREGQVLVFPAKTWHGTIPSDCEGDRISVVGDLVILLKESAEREHFMPAFSQWKKL